MVECDIFFPGSRQRQICEGVANLPLSYINAFRRRHGLVEFQDLTNTPSIGEGTDTPAIQVRPLKIIPVSKQLRCCDGRSLPQTPEVVTLRGEGPGTELINILKSVGFTACPDCIMLANIMNDWGIEGCISHLPQIVADILPRALAWERAKLGWISALIPTGVSSATIQYLVLNSIEHSKKKMN